jgi:hypothetical protein
MWDGFYCELGPGRVPFFKIARQPPLRVGPPGSGSAIDKDRTNSLLLPLLEMKHFSLLCSVVGALALAATSTIQAAENPAPVKDIRIILHTNKATSKAPFCLQGFPITAAIS